MPRISELRAPAEPVSESQKDRYQRILRAASRLGSQHGLERVQMADVAKDAGVAIATVYRYFPSKNELFAAVMRSQVERLDEELPPAEPDADPVGAVAVLLTESCRRMLSRPKLATATLQANNAAQLQAGPGHSPASSAFTELLLHTLGCASADREPDDEDRRMVRLIEQTWYGILVSTLNGHISQEQAELDIELACRLLLGPTYGEGPSS